MSVSASLATRPGFSMVLIWFGILPACVMLLIAVLGPYFLMVDPNQQNLTAAFSGPSATYILGADQLGRSVAARVVAGARISLGLAFLGMITAATTGALSGFVSAWCGGAIRETIMRIADVIIGCPTLLLVILIAGLFGGSAFPVFAGLWLAQWPKFTRLSCAVARRELASDHVEAAKLLGFPTSYVLGHHVLPGAVPYLASTSALTLGANVLTIASVGFLGVGLRPPTAEWGAIIAESMSYIRTAPHIVLVPAGALVISTLAATVIGESIAARFSQGDEPL